MLLIAQSRMIDFGDSQQRLRAAFNQKRWLYTTNHSLWLTKSQTLKL